MAAHTNNSFLTNTGLNEHNSFTHLLQSISTNLENEIDLIDQSMYYSETDFVNLYQQTNREISILNLNCQCLNAKIDKLKMFLSVIDVNSQITCITLQESWCGDTTDMSGMSIPGYTMITKYNRAEVSNHGGLIIYLNNEFDFRELPGTQSFVHEILGIEIWRKTPITIINLYFFQCIEYQQVSLKILLLSLISLLSY